MKQIKIISFVFQQLIKLTIHPTLIIFQILKVKKSTTKVKCSGIEDWVISTKTILINILISTMLNQEIISIAKYPS